jgi:mannitol/fructose-specific phosphotransferase system IIA component (Ntr-type)
VKIQELLLRSNVLLDVKAGDKEHLIELLARLLASAYGLASPDTVAQRVLERESQVSTGIGLGVAIPHCRIEGLERSCMVAARTAEPVEFDAIDEQPVRLVFLMVSPANTVAEHADVLSRLSHVLAEEKTRAKLLTVVSAEEFVAAVAEAEDTLA